MKSSLLTLAVIVFITLTSSAQFFVQDGKPCPSGKRITLDTLFYSSSEPMPFDRCFILLIPYKNPGTVAFFAINPVDVNGQSNIRRRDYHAFLKSGYPKREERQNIRKLMPYSAFKKDFPFVRLFTQIDSVAKDNIKYLALKVSPLDPNREYQLYIITKDAKTTNSFEEVARLYMQAEQGGKINFPALATAVTQYDNSWKINKRDTLLNSDKFDLLLNAVSGYTDTIPVDRDSTLGYRINAYNRFFFSTAPININLPGNPLLAYSNYLQLPDSSQSKKISFSYLMSKAFQKGTKDMAGTPLSNTKYYVYALTIDSLKDKRVKKVVDTITYPPNLLAEITLKKDPTELTITTTEKFLENPLPKLYQSIAANKDAVIKLEAATLCLFPKFPVGRLMHTILKFNGNYTHYSDLVLKNDTTRSLSLLYEQDATRLQNMITGLFSLLNPDQEVEKADYATRRDNIKASVTQIRNIRELILKVNSVDLIPDAGMAALYSCLGEYEKNMMKADKELAAIISNEKQKYSLLETQYATYKYNKITTGSTELDFKSGAKLRIVPDFGFVGIFKGEGLEFQDMTPYLGFHINFRSIDKDIPFSQVRFKSWRHYISFMAGITLRSIAIENKRDDFFDKKSLLTGLGIRVHNYLRVTGGMVWFKTTDVNPLNSDRPLKFSPFVGLALDLELRDLFEGISSLIK